MLHLEVNITEQEIEVVIQALEEYSSDLNMEIADTEKMEYRELLKRNRIILNSFISALKEQKVLSA